MSAIIKGQGSSTGIPVKSVFHSSNTNLAKAGIFATVVPSAVDELFAVRGVETDGRAAPGNDPIGLKFCPSLALVVCNPVGELGAQCDSHIVVIRILQDH